MFRKGQNLDNRIPHTMADTIVNADAPTGQFVGTYELALTFDDKWAIRKALQSQSRDLCQRISRIKETNAKLDGELLLELGRLAYTLELL